LNEIKRLIHEKPKKIENKLVKNSKKK